MDDLRGRIEQRIKELLAAREQYRTEAMKQIYAYDAAIGELQRLLENEPEPDDD